MLCDFSIAPFLSEPWAHGIDYSELLVSGTCEADFLVTDIVSSEAIITISQVEQALCDEAETGRIHGCGSFRNGCWVSDNGQYFICLNREWRNCNGFVPYSQGVLSHISGQPCIVWSGWSPQYQNHSEEWNTQWPYLRMSAGVIPFPNVLRSIGGATRYEWSIAGTLRQKFGLSGCWGGSNRIAATSHWEEDKSLLIAPIDASWKRFEVKNSQGVPVHNVIARRQNGIVIVLPEIILRRPEFDARRVFWLSEKTHYPFRSGKGISGVVNVTLSLPKGDLFSDDLFLCYPGGANAVDICDLTLIHWAKEVNLLVLNKQGLEGWKFAMLFAARLRKEGIDFSLKLLVGNQSEILSLKKFRKYLRAQGLTVPAELSDDFGGRLNAYMEHKRQDLIPGILGKGEVMLITGDHAAEVAFCLAISVRQGCWNGGWRAVKRSCKVLLFADRCDLTKIEKVKLPNSVDIRSGDILLENAKQAVSKCSLVIFASQAMRNDKARFIEILDFCLKQDISAIVFSTKTDSFLEQNARRFYSIRHSSDNYTLASQQEKFGVRFSLNGKGQLASCCNLEEHEIVDFDSNSKRVESDNGMNDFNKSISNIPQGQIFNSIEDLIGN